MNDLRRELAERWPLTGDAAEGMRDRLLDAYADPARGYHDLVHLGEVLTRLDALADAGETVGDDVILAAWFHDAVYDDRPDLEERSARLAEETLPALGVSPERTAEVARLVRLTASHRPAPDDRAGASLVDADLAILAADQERYADYVAGVRREWAHVGEADFRAGRSAVLRDLAAKPALFHTEHAAAQWEQPARANLAREIADLES